MKFGFKRFVALTIVLIFFFGLTAPAFATEISTGQDAADSAAGFYEETGNLLDSAQMAGEVIVCVSDSGAALLQARLADTDIVLTNMMDVTDSVENLDSDTRCDIFGAGVVPESCRIMAVQSPTMDTESLIAFLESCDGVYFAEANTVTELSDLTPEETTEDTVEETLSGSSANDEVLLQDQTEELSANENTDAVVQNIPIDIPETDDTSKSDMTVMQWALENLGKVFNGKAGVDVNLQGKKTNTTNKTIICVMDTGIDYTHEDLKNRMIDLDTYTNASGEKITDATGCGSYGYNAMNPEDHSDPMDYNGHGTHCAGIIAGEGNSVSGTAGIMDDASLIAVKVSNGSGMTNLDILNGMKWVLRAKTEFGVNIAAVNFSIRTLNSSSVFKLTMAELDQADVTFCIGSGNDANDHGLNEFFGFNKADSGLVVDSINANGNKSNFSDYGLRTDLFGTGAMIYSTVTEYADKTDHTEKSASHFDGAAYGEAGKTHAYAGFDGNGKDTLKFHEVTSASQAHAALTTDYYKSGGQSLMLPKGTTGSVILESDAVDLTDEAHSCYNKNDPLYFDMGAFTVDNDPVEYYNLYTLVSVEVKYTSGAKEGQTDYETYAVHYDLSDDAYSWYDFMVDFESFETNRTSLGSENQASFKAIARASSSAKPLSEWIASHKDDWTVDYTNFRIRLETCSTKNIKSDGSIDSNAVFDYTVCLDSIALGSQAGYYDYMSGTSMATPSVTGVYGLVYSYYGKENAEDTQYECNDKISARIAGSVTTTFKDGESMGLDQYCITGGIVNASAALSTDESSFNPVIQSASVSGDKLTLKGWFLGNQGSITIGGKTVPAEDIVVWQKDKNDLIDDADNAGMITVKIPEDITGEQIVTVTNAKEKTGRYYTDCSRVATNYEDQALPGSFSEDAETSFEVQKLAVIDHELYLYGMRSDYQQMLDVYDTETGIWRSVPMKDPAVPSNSLYGLATVGNKIYGLFQYSYSTAAGDVSGQKLCRLDIQDGTADWTTVLEMENRLISAIVASEDQLYILGGCNSKQEPIQTVDKVIFEENGSCSLEKVMDMGTSISMQFNITAKGGKIYAMYSGTDLIKIDLNEKTVTTDLPVPADGAKMDKTALATTPFGLILNASTKTGSTMADTWFFDTTTETWQASDLLLDSALSCVIGSATVGDKVYVLGKSRNGNFWFVRTLDFEADDEQRVTWVMGSEEDAVFRIDISFPFFTGKVTMDGEELSTDNYTATSGSTIITLKNAYLKTLSAGTHTMTVYFNVNGKEVAVNCSLVITEEKANVNTGIQNSDSGTTAAIALVLLAAVFGCVLMIRRKTEC